MRLRPPRTPEREELITLHVDVAEDPTVQGRTRKVLLLEDRDDFQEVIRDYLISCSYDVISVNSGIDGLREIMNKGGFDLILCDMMMPQMGGEMFYWAVTRVRPATRERFIFFTGHKNNPRIEFFFRRVNATVLYKPFKLSVLDSAIRDIFRRVG
jgi:CheY-like chemotaxis protein